MKKVNEHFEFKTLGNITEYIGINIEQTDYTVTLYQPETKLLNKNTGSNPRNYEWNYHREVVIDNYLENKTSPEISVSVHQLEIFLNDLKIHMNGDVLTWEISFRNSTKWYNIKTKSKISP